MQSVYINATQGYYPNKPVDNENIENVLGFINGRPSRSKAIVLNSNKIQTRHYAIDPETRKPNFTNASLTAACIESLFQNHSQIKMEDADLLACGTSSPDLMFPAHANMVHGHLKNFKGEVMTMAGVCTSSSSALKAAFTAIKSGESKGAIVAGSETASKSLRSEFFPEEDPAKLELLKKDKSVAFEHDFLRWMLSDAAGAMYLSAQPVDGEINFKINWIESRSYANEEKVCMFNGGYREENGEVTSWKEARLEKDEKKLKFAMNVFQDVRLLREKVTYLTVERPVAEFKKKHGLHPGDYTWFVPHYSSEFFREILAESLQRIDFMIPQERWFTTLTSRGNVGAASILVFLDDLRKQKDLKNGDKILCYVPESARFSCYWFELEVVK